MTVTIVTSTLVGLVLAAYGWIFKGINKRMDKIEQKQDNCDIIFLRIETSLAQIQADLKWLKDKR